MKRIAILMCLALIGSLLHAAVGSVSSFATVTHPDGVAVATHTHHEATWGIEPVAMHHEHGSHAMQSNLSASDLVTEPCTDGDAAPDSCHSPQNECCLGAALLPASQSIVIPAQSTGAVVMAMRIATGGEPDGIFKPPRS